MKINPNTAFDGKLAAGKNDVVLEAPEKQANKSYITRHGQTIK